MDGRKNEPIATTDDEGLKDFVRSSPQELEASELALVAGGAGVIIDPNG